MHEVIDLKIGMKLHHKVLSFNTFSEVKDE